MKAVEIKDFWAMCDGGERRIKAWAAAKNSQIVVHHRIGFGDGFFGDFVLTHRRSGMSIRSWAYHYATKQLALAAAVKIDKFPEWKKIGRPKTTTDRVPGVTEKLKSSVRRKLETALGK